MTRVWIAAGLAGLVILLAVTELRLTWKTSNDIWEILEETEISAKNSPDKAGELCGDIEEIWESKKKKLAMFLSHEELESVDISIERLNRLAEVGNFEQFYIECGTLRKELEGLKETEYVNLHNLL